MSTAYYQELWHQTQNELKKTIAFDRKLRKPGSMKDVNTAKWLIGHLYMKYIQIANKLDECYDQIIHPQKRELLGRLLDLCMGRLLELKSEIVKIESDNYIFYDNILIELKLTHEDMEIKVPQYFWRDKEKAVEHRRELMKQVFEEAEREKFYYTFVKGIPEKDRGKAWEKYLEEIQREKMEKEKLEEQQRKIMKLYARDSPSVEKMKTKEQEEEKVPEEVVAAIKLIQRHERARQGRVSVSVATTHKNWKKLKDEGLEVGPEMISAATVIQRHWRRYRKRVRESKTTDQLKELLGEKLPFYVDKSKFKKLDAVKQKRRILQEKNQKEYEEALAPIKEKVTALYSIPFEEDIVDEIRAWFMQFFNKTDFLPNYPPRKPIIPTGAVLGFPKQLDKELLEKTFPLSLAKTLKIRKGANLSLALSAINPIGGSALNVAGLWIGPLEFLICLKEIEKMKAEKGKGKKPEKKKETKQEKKKEEEFEFRMAESNFVDPLAKADRDYRVTWMDLDESKNVDQKYVPEFVKDEMCMELSMKVRKAVDEMMILELEILKDALQADKFPKKKKRKKNKPKKEKKEKVKPEKFDPTANRTLDELFIELYKNGIIRNYEEAHLNDYFGERSFGAFDMRERLEEWPPSSGDVRDLILQLCILPLGSWRIRQLTPLIKSICLLGPENSGKEFLARVICTETAAVMFDLSPDNVYKQYPGKAGQKQFEHLIEKMSRALQPSVIFVNGAERTFYKRVPKEEREKNPKRMAGFIQKFTKGIKAPDQVLLLGVSSQPWLAQKAKFLKIYQRLIMVPKMDYPSYVKLWQLLLKDYHSIPFDFDVSCLAKVSSGYSVKAIIDTIKNVMNISRISRSKLQPFQPLEFLEELFKAHPIDQKLENKCIKFYDKTKLPKNRAKMIKLLKEERELSQKK